jgi:hypothetical protein
MDRMNQRLAWVKRDVEDILKADPTMLEAIQQTFQHQAIELNELFKDAKLAIAKGKKLAKAKLYDKKIAEKKALRPKAYVVDLHPHLHKKIAPVAPMPDGSEEIVAQLRKEQRAKQEAERAKYKAWSQEAENAGEDDDSQ